MDDELVYPYPVEPLPGTPLEEAIEQMIANKVYEAEHYLRGEMKAIAEEALAESRSKPRDHPDKG